MNEKNELKMDNGSLTLFKNGQTAFCYRTNPIVIPTQLGSAQIQRMGCNNSCPAFKIQMNDEQKVFVNICCGSIGVSHLISNVNANTPDNQGNIIKLKP